MSLLSSLFQKSRNLSLFSVVNPWDAPTLTDRNYLDAYRRSWVYACTSAIADEVATIDLKLEIKTGSGWKEVKSHPAIDLLGKVNAFYSSDELFRATQSYLELEGNAFWYIAYNATQPAEIWPLNPTQVTVIRDEKNFIGGYIFQNVSGRRIPLAPDEVVHFKRFNPTDPYRGIGTITALSLAIDSDVYAAEWNRNFFANSALPAFALKTEANLTQEQYDEFMEKWKERFQGVSRSHLPAVLAGGMDVVNLSVSQKDMDFLSARQWGRDEILAGFKVPKSVLGIVEDVNRANAEATDYIYAKRTILPRNRFITTVLTELYLPLWKLDPSKYRITATDPTPQNQELELLRREKALTTGYVTRNEIRALDGLKPIDGGDELLVPNTYVPLSQAIAPKPAPVVTPPAGQPTKAKALDVFVDHRVRFFREAIGSATTKVEAVLTQMQADTEHAIKHTGKALQTLEPDAVPDSRAAELSKKLFIDWEKYLPLLSEVLQEIDAPALAFGGERALSSTGVSIAFDLANPRAVAWVRDRGLQMASSIADGLKDELRSRISAGVEAGASIDEIAGSLGQFFDEQSQWRALRIARTEVLSSYAQGSLEGARQAGLGQKRWITAEDDRVDDECAMNAEAGWIDREQSFPSGHDAPTVHPNCRCDIEFQ